MANAIRRDLKIAIKNLPYLPLIFGCSIKSVIQEYSELRNLDSTLNLFKREASPQGEDTVPHEDWFFINGICTTPALAELNCKHLSQIFNRQVKPLYNPTRGFMSDIIESIFSRVLDIKEPFISEFFHRVKASILDKEKVVIIGHSQGGIIVSSLIKKLKQDESISNLLHKIEVYTFASAGDELAQGVNYAEHFCNTRDYVARIGALSYKNSVFGKVFTAPLCGHLLSQNYLDNFINKAYCNGQSRLYSYTLGEN